MEQPKYRYIYGPVSSWRIGQSLGVDPVSSAQKTCTFDCVYCQVGKTRVSPKERKIFVPTEDLIAEIRSLPSLELDAITFAGSGEPTLASNLGEMIEKIRSFRKEKIVVITNASLITRPDVRRDLLLADTVLAKLDAFSETTLGRVNQPMSGILLGHIIQGLKDFRQVFRGHLALQIMFIKENRPYASEIARIAKEIHPDEVEVNTPLRKSRVKPLPEKELSDITDTFRKICGKGILVRNVYEAKREKSKPLCRDATDRRRGKETS